MSRFVGKTFESLNSILNNSGLFQSNQNKSLLKNQSTWHLDSKSVSRKLKVLESEQEKEEVIKSYLTGAEKRLSDPDVTPDEIEDMIRMCMTCETMGYPAFFIYIHCLKLAQKGNLQQKHTGYMAAEFFLNPNHELVVLLINTIQKDLLSSNYMEVLLALSAVCSLINKETVHDILHLVEDKLNHAKSVVRKTAILTLDHCLRLIDSQSAYQMSFSKLEKALTDSDLEVVSAAVCTIYKFVQVLPGDYSYLIDSLVELQNQILLRRVPRNMTYCDIPAPWLQIDILKLLKYVYKNSEQAQIIVPVLKKTLQQVSLQSTLAHAILYQVIDIISHIESPNDLVEMGLSSVSTLLKSRNVNLKLIGVEALIVIVKKIKPSIAATQQEIIMECLTLPDETLQLKTLELLYHLANPFNVQAICKKLMEFLVTSASKEKKSELALKLLELAKLYPEKKEWCVSVIVFTLVEAGCVLPTSHLHDIINFITKDNSLKENAKKSCLFLVRQKQKISCELIKLIAAILTSTSEFEETLPYLLEMSDDSAATWLLVSLTETVLKTKEISSQFVAYLTSLDISFCSSQQILKELINIIQCLAELKNYDPNEKVDPSLSFLDSFLVQSMESNSSCYQPLSYRSNSVCLEDSLVFKPEEIPLTSNDASTLQESVNSQSQNSAKYSAISSPSTSFQSLSISRETSLNQTPTSVKSVWTETGRIDTSNSEREGSHADSDCPEKPKDDLHDLFAGIS